MALDVSIRPGARSRDAASCQRVQRSKSLVPPSIVELSSGRVVLSWRATIGQCSIRTEVPEGSTDQGWSNLEEDTNRHRGARAAVRTSAVDVFEVDHVELQTCLGCPQCLHGEDDGEEDEEETMEHQYGRGCWRPIYQGPDSRCEVDLGRGNALQYFRLLVRARLPPPEQRGYMRAKNPSLIGFEAAEGRAFEKLGDDRGDGKSEGLSPSNQTSPHRWRRRRLRGQQHPAGVRVVSLSDSDGATCSVGIGDCSPENGSDTNPSRGRGTEGVTLGGEPTTLAGGRAQWFASDSVFVDSRPPPATLHGIGTALVLTWPGVVGLSGAEEVSYILEQWSHAATCTASPPSRKTEHRAAAAAAAAAPGDSGSAEYEPNQTSPLEHSSRRRHRRRHHPHRLTPPKHVEAREAFSVGTRCWFMPTRLHAGKRYWYRLRLIHEGGRSVGGPWVSHSTCVAPPRCVEVGSRGLVLALPRAIGEDVSPAFGADDARGRASGGQVRSKRIGGETEQTSATTGGNAERLAAREVTGEQVVNTVHMGGEGGEPSDAGRGDGEGEREREDRQEETEAPMLWYTLEGITRTAGWIVLYRGPAPEVIVEGLQPNTLVKFRVGIDVDITELRHRSLGPLGFLELEASLPGDVPTTADICCSPATDVASPAAAKTSDLSSPKLTPPSRQRSLSPQRSVVVRPALRLCSAAARYGDRRGTGISTANTSNAEQWPRPWSPAASPAMSQMKREGFAVHDVAATVGGGFYPERPLLSWGRLQAHRGGAVWECGSNRAGEVGDRPQQCREYSAVGEFSTASMPPRFASFVVGGVPQVKLWWAQPRPDTGLTTSPAQIRPATAPPSYAASNTLADNRQEHRRVPTKATASSPTQGRPSTPVEVVERRLIVGGEASTEAPPHNQHKYAVFTLDVLQPAADGGGTTARSIVSSGPELWTDLARASSPSSAARVGALPTIAPSTAYCVRLSTKTTAEQPAAPIEAVVVTAPPAPALEPATAGENAASPGATAGEGLAVVGAVTLKATWSTGIDTSFLPAGVEPSPVSFALEMAHAREAGPRACGAGGTATKVARTMASSRDAPPPAFSFPSARGAAAADASSSTNGARSPGSVEEIPVREDAGLGQCWTLGSSSWGRPKTRAEGFRVVWTGEEARTEGGVVKALTPPLPPGMRFAFRVRVECRFGVAVSAATVYQTAVVAPLAPKGLRAILATHESRAGNIGRCVRLLWDPFPPGHGKNVIASFTVQARRPRYPSGDQTLQDAARSRSPPVLGRVWQNVCACPEIGCLDPTTLGVPHIVAEYRVRAEGPGGEGPWSESLPVDVVAPAVENADKRFGAPSGDFRVGGGGGSGRGGGGGTPASSVTCINSEGKVSPRQPMDFFRPGTRVRDPLTGEARRLWTKHRPLRVSPPPPAVAALVLPGAVITARTVAAAEHNHRRAGGSNQLLWGALASPRAARDCRIAATMTSSGLAPEESEMHALHDDLNGGITSGRAEEAGNSENRREPMLVGEASTPRNQARGHLGSEAAAAAVPHNLAMILREEVDVSCRLGGYVDGPWDGRMADAEGCGGREDEGDGSIAGLLGTAELYRRNPDRPVVAWIAQSPVLNAQNHGSRDRRSQDHNIQQQDQHQHQRRRGRRRRRRPATTTPADRGTTQKDRFVGEVLLAQPSQRQHQRQPRSRSKSPLRSHHSHRRPGGGGGTGARRGGDGGRGGATRRQAPHVSGGAGDLDCYRRPNSGKPAANRGGLSTGGPK